MGQRGKPKLVWRKRRNPDGSYEWALDTPDCYERELKRKQFGDPVIDALLQGAPAVNKVVTRLFSRHSRRRVRCSRSTLIAR
jgi:hypothetical protein